MNDIGALKNCQNPDSFGEICVKCNKCGRFDREKQIEIEKQIEEMACDICPITHLCRGGYQPTESCYSFRCAKVGYENGYRKQSEGEWVKTGVGITERVVCSICKSEKGSFMRPPFCNQCGAKMKGGE